MRKEFAYAPFESDHGTVHRSVLSVQVEWKGSREFLEFVVDSGADSSMLSRDAARSLGIPLSGGDWRDVHGIAGKVRCFKRNVKLAVPGFEDSPFDAVVLVSDRLGVNLLGHDNFFQHFRVGFDSKERKLFLDDRKS